MAGRPTRAALAAELRQGFDALMRGDIDAASAHCRRVIGQAPRLAEAHFLVGLIALASDDKRTAISAFGSVTKIDPTHAAAWAQLARLFTSLGQMNRADRALAEAVRHGTDDPVVADAIGSTYSLLGEHDEAEHWYRRCTDAAARHVPYLVNRANNLVYLGRIDAALETVERILGLDPGNPQAHWIKANARRVTDRSHIERMEQLVASRTYPPRAAAFLSYAIGKEYEDLGLWEPAFDAFADGAAARRATLDYDEAAEAAMFDALESLYTSEWLASRPAGDPDSSPVFIVGQPRTGTTLVERIVTSHSAVHSAGELQQFGFSIRRVANVDEPKRFGAGLAERARDVDPAELGRAYLAATTKARGTLPRFVDKLPLNFLYLPLILAALPNATVIHVRRHPMDACFASFKQLFADAYPHSYDLEEMARHHVRYRRLMDVWRDRFGERFTEVDYEALTRDMPGEARRLIAALDLDWESGVLDFHRRDDAVATASAVQVREPVHTRSVDRWRHYESQLEPVRRVLTEAGIEV